MDNRTANKIINTRKVGWLEIDYVMDDKRWRVFGFCVSTGHPVASWVYGEKYKLGEGPTLAEAAKAALSPT